MSKYTRRRFLTRTLTGTAAMIALPRLRAGFGETSPATMPVGLEFGAALGPIVPAAKSTVAEIVSPYVHDSQKMHPTLPREMVEEGLRIIFGQEPTPAWRSLLQKDKTIGIKFDLAYHQPLGTAEELAIHLVQSLADAGFAPEQIVLIEAPETEKIRALKTQPQKFGWSADPIDFNSGKEQTAAVLDQVDGIINVPFLQVNRISGIAGCLRNVTLPFIRRQTPYFRNGCIPYITDILKLPKFQSKLRLNIVNGIRAIFEQSSSSEMINIWPFGGLILSKDPVAADASSADLLNTERLAHQLSPILDPAGRLGHIHHAAEHNLGTDDQDYINLVPFNFQ